ncbi:MAG: hypothetical protein A2V52_05940 [Actinobacteria bacterium RBG_19FT_COMBO_54_7]|uniref:DJ-1/PfpI domain-containing protein n=1 Tax=Candidatus Solincola sediminis TaxID=1797199 RepID=A0A1F2WP04_9ACTN|nr:MAG: hypothetical protein A2Y75_10285 [Candidatus Solincola sediminis]OFW61843.1 MAG: hypothetical protein A2W01_11065 [Candidatus Solincola sediminis]OFW66358.1 MAG: hypothetical protein A2V52_05940 [Actinobacteria bacterium RBG_19FT_COMBO_54_7]
MDLSGKRIATLLGEGFQDQEALEPIGFFKSHGAEVTIVGEEKGAVHGLHGAILEAERTFNEANISEFDAIFIPGGRSPAYLRKFPDAVGFVRSFAETDKLIATICHAGQLLAAADLVKDLTLTGYPGIKEEMEQAGANFVDQPVVADRNVVSSRLPEDIPVFNEKVKELLSGKAKSSAA